MALINFYKQPAAPQEATLGSIWFNTVDKTVEVLTSKGWDKYGGKLVDSTWENNKLTITKADGSSIQLDFSDVASLSGIQTALTNLRTDLTTEINAAKTAASTADSKAVAAQTAADTEKSRAEAAESALGERITGVANELTAEVTRATGVESGLNTRLTAAETAITNLASATHFIGVKTALPETGADGDIVIVGNKEYIYDSTSTPKWVELGDTTAEAARIGALETLTGTHTTQIEGLGQQITTLGSNVAETYVTKSSYNEKVAALDAKDSAIEGEIESLKAKDNELVAEDTRIAGLVTSEESRAKGEESRIEGLITAEADTARAAEKANAGEIEGLKARATALETADTGLKAEDTRLAGLITSEENRAKGEESRLEGLITQEASTARAAEQANAANIAALQTKSGELEAEDTRLAGLITTEASTARAAEEQLGKDIAAEVKTRGEEDAKLDARITSEVATLNQAIADSVAGAMTWKSFLDE